ncbi:MAG TPA: cytochrome c-type biogenesis protein CcmH [Chloroflexota bacterium]|nr:cytochrome c-type biogenesis protein CcmH [Chloroflexota bacterium]
MFRASRWLLALGFLVVLGPGTVRADATDDAVRRIALKLQCPVCEGQTVADSPSGLAQDMRSVIRTHVLAGESEQQILDAFVASYGDGILTEPPKHGISLGVWFGPLLALALGLALLLVVVKSWRRQSALAASAELTAPDPLVADELRRFREEFGQ